MTFGAVETLWLGFLESLMKEFLFVHDYQGIELGSGSVYIPWIYFFKVSKCALTEFDF